MHHILKALATDYGRAGAGHIIKYIDEDEAVIGAPGADGGLLLRDGEILGIAAGIAAIGVEAGARGEGKRTHHRDTENAKLFKLKCQEDNNERKDHKWQFS